MLYLCKAETLQFSEILMEIDTYNRTCKSESCKWLNFAFSLALCTFFYNFKKFWTKHWQLVQNQHFDHARIDSRTMPTLEIHVIFKYDFKIFLTKKSTFCFKIIIFDHAVLVKAESRHLHLENQHFDHARIVEILLKIDSRTCQHWKLM